MDIEFSTDYLLCRFFGRLNICRPTLLEIGLGSGNYSFQWANQLGFRCIAVEPLPVELLRILSAQLGIELIEAAVGAESGKFPIYHGVLHGNELADISSMNSNWWGVGMKHTIVNCYTLLQLCKKYSIQQIDLLKVDTEGSELQILGLLKQMPLSLLPRIISFEYGGGGQPLANRKGGWAPEFFNGTCEILRIARGLGYSATMVIEANRVFPSIKSGDHAFASGSIFASDFLVGNIVLIRDSEDVCLLRSLTREAGPILLLHEALGRWKIIKFEFRHLFLKAQRGYGKVIGFWRTF